MSVNSLYLKVTLKVLIMRRQNAYPNKCVAFKYNLVAVYQKSVKSSLQVTQMKHWRWALRTFWLIMVIGCS